MSGGRDLIRHPGSASPSRVLIARGESRRLVVTLPAGAILMDAVASVMDEVGCDSGVMVLDGLMMGQYRYVMPGPSKDNDHAAWYSAKHEGHGARLHYATAIVGRRDGNWWLHCHAIWDVEHIAKCGHLLPDEVMIAEDAQIVLHTFKGGAFEVQHDEETNFDIFHAVGGAERGNALIVKIAPHEDAYATLAALARNAGFAQAEIVGIGSLIGAQFENTPGMTSPISEVLITPDGAFRGDALHLPIYCVDPSDGHFSGALVEGGGPVCVTFEAMVIEA